MKAIKNKKRFDARRFLSERKEEAIEETNANYNSFSLDNWLEEEVVSEYVLDLDPARDDKADRPVPPPASHQTGITVKIRPQKEQDKILQGLSNGIITRDELTKLTTDTSMEEACGDPEMDPEEAQPAIADLSPDEAFGAGWSAAVEEIMASVQGLLDDPMDMGVGPEEEESALVVAQLPDHAMEVNEEDSDSSWVAAVDKLVDAWQQEKDALAKAPKTLAAIMAINSIRTSMPLTPGEKADRDREYDNRLDNLEES